MELVNVIENISTDMIVRDGYSIDSLINNDALTILKEMPEGSVDLIVTDPPYKTTKRGISENTTTGGLVRSELGKQGKIFKHNDLEIKQWMPELYRVLKQDSHCYIMTNHVNLHEMLNVAKECGFHFIKSLIWMKDNKIMGQCYMSQFEYILFFRKGRHKKINKCGTSDILQFPNKKTKDSNGKNIHDTEKPIELMKVLIENSSQEEDIVLDPFMGVGSVPLACIDLNRRYIGVEIDDKYYNITTNRIEEISK